MNKELRAVANGHIAKWRIESEEERELALKADINTAYKEKYCEFYRKADPMYYNKGIEMAKVEIKKHCQTGGDYPSEEELIVDMIYSLHRFGFSYSEYFWFKLYNLSTFGREGFISDKMRYEYYIDLNTREGENLLRNKGLAYDRLKKYYDRECLAINTTEDKEKFTDFIEKHERVFYKPIALDSAKGCCIIEKSTANFEEMIKHGAFIVEELIVQDGDFAKFYPGAVNLIRIPTLTTKDGNIHLIGPFITIGNNNIKAVNAGAGGIVATIDPESGTIVGNGWVEDSDIEYSHHPQTGKQIIGYTIPDWDKAVAIAKEASKLIPECKYIGFDLASTSKGWIIIEANCYAQFLGQKNTNGLRRQMLECLRNI